MHTLARQLLAGLSPRTEYSRADPSGSDAVQAVQACEQLRIPVTRLAGTVGFASLMSRALTVTKRQVPEFVRLRVVADGSLEGYQELPRAGSEAEATRQGGVILLAELLDLLFALIGESLTLSLVSEAWPNHSPETMALNTQGKILEEQP